MGRYFTLTLGRSAETKNKTKKVKGESRYDSLIARGGFGIFILTLLVVFGLLYVFTVNSTATKGYEIRDLEKQISELKESNKRLEFEASGLKSIQNIKTKTETFNLVPSKEVRYIHSSDYAYYE